jgi:hypothetical protein
MKPHRLWNSLSETKKSNAAPLRKKGAYVQPRSSLHRYSELKPENRRLQAALLRYGNKAVTKNKHKEKYAFRHGGVETVNQVHQGRPALEHSPDGAELIDSINRLHGSMTRELMFKEIESMKQDYMEEAGADYRAIRTDVGSADVEDGGSRNWIHQLPNPKPVEVKDHLPRTFTKPKEMIQSLMISNGSFQAQLHRHGLSRGNWSHSAKTEKHGTGENDNLQTEKRLPIKKDGNSVKLPAGDIIPKFVQYDRHGAKAPKAHCLPDFTHTYESEHAALRIQKLWRGVSARMEVHLPGGAKEQWMATKIQRHYRMYSVRREYLLYKEVHAMMTDLQEKHGRLLVRVARGMLGRVKARHFRESRTNACIRIQTCFRGWYQRERGKVRKKIYYKWKAMTIQRVWRGHWGRQVFRATRFRVNAAKHLRTDPKAQWGIVQVGMRLHKVRHDFRKLDGLINAHNQAAWHQLFKKGPRVLAEGSEGTLLSKRGPSVGLRTRLYSHALFQLSRDGLSKSIFPDLGIVIYMRKFELLGYGHVPPSHASPLGETHMFHTGSKFDTIDDPTLLYLVIAIYEQGTNMIVEIFDPETHFECVPIRINAKELQAMCRKNPSMLEGGKRYVDLRKWIARSLYIRKRPQSLCLCCPPLERARRYIKHELAATHISRIARGYMSKCRVKRIVFALREKKRQRSLISKLRKPI